MNEFNHISVNLFGCIKEDGRTSLDHYANELSKSFLDLELQHKLYKPSIIKGDLGIAGRMGLRTGRYLGYPNLVSSLPDNEISHVIDDGYAHLFSNIRSRYKVITLTDLMPLLGWKKKVQGLDYPHPPLLYSYSLNHLKRFDQIITFSESNKRQLAEFRICEPKKIRVVPLGVDKEFFEMSDMPQQQARNMLGLNAQGKFVLITGALQYKNLGNSLEAALRFKERSQENIKVIRLGSETDYWKKLESKYKSKLPITSFTNLTRKEVGLVYRSADLLLFPSWHEGFGMPLVEAMACGIPTVISDRGSLPEISGGTSSIVEPNDIEKMSFHVQENLKKEANLDARVGVAKLVARKYLWSNIGIQTASIYDEVMR